MGNRRGVKGPGRGFLLICFGIVCISLIGTAGAENEDREIIDSFVVRENEIREEHDKVRDEADELANAMTDERRQEKTDAEELTNNREKILRKTKIARKKLKVYQNMRSRKRNRREGKGFRRPRFIGYIPTVAPVKGQERENIILMVKCVKNENPEELDLAYERKLESPLKRETIDEIIRDYGKYRYYDELLDLFSVLTGLKEKWGAKGQFDDKLKIVEYCLTQPSHPWAPTTTTMSPISARVYITRLIKCVKKRRPMTLDEEVGKELNCTLDDKTIEDITKVLVNKYGSNEKAFVALGKMAEMPDEQDPWRVSSRCASILPAPRTGMSGILAVGGKRKGAVLTFGGKPMPGLI